MVMASPNQFRPGPSPPSLKPARPGRVTTTRSRRWAQGTAPSARRKANRASANRVLDATAPAVYWPVARSVATAPGRNVTDKCALAGGRGDAMDDALTAVFDAKYTYTFWRPVTAIRNGGPRYGNDPPSPNPAGRRSSTRPCTPSIRVPLKLCPLLLGAGSWRRSAQDLPRN